MSKRLAESSAGTAKRGRGPGRPFPEGVSGNPGGRAKEAHDVKEAARTWSMEAIKRLAHWMRGNDARASIAAATAILDRAWGKPVQEIAGADGTAVIDLNIEVVRDSIAAKLQRIADAHEAEKAGRLIEGNGSAEEELR